MKLLTIMLEAIILYFVGIATGLGVTAICGPSQLGMALGEIAWTAVWAGYVIYKDRLTENESIWKWMEPSTNKISLLFILFLTSILLRYNMWPRVPETVRKMANPSEFSAFAVVLLIPLREELFYRGFVLRRLSTAMGFWGALVISSIAFAIGHRNLLSALLQGILLGWLYSPKGFGFLAASIVYHIMNNLLSVFP